MRHKRKFILIPFGIVAFLSLFSYIVMLLWNALLPAILHVTAITFWQAMGILILCKILFGFGGHGGRFGGPWMRGGMGERFKNMSPEERMKFKEEMRGRCGWRRGRYGNHEHFGHDSFDTEKEPVKETPAP